MDRIDRLYAAAPLRWNVAVTSRSAKLILKVLSDLRFVGYAIEDFRHVFGCPNCRLSAGRAIQDDCSLEEFQKTVQGFMDLGIGCRLTMQKYLTVPDDLTDEYSNRLLAILNDCGKSADHGVICSSDELMHHVRENYPNLRVISSLVKPAVEIGLSQDTAEYYNRLLSKYDEVVVGASRVFEEGFVESIADPSRIEVIVNSLCTRNCKLAKNHYLVIEAMNEAMVRFGRESVQAKVCSMKLEQSHQACLRVKAKERGRNMLSMSTEEVDALVRQGIRSFKLEGREYGPFAVLNDLTYYMTQRNIFYRYIRRDVI